MWWNLKDFCIQLWRKVRCVCASQPTGTELQKQALRSVVPFTALTRTCFGWIWTGTWCLPRRNRLSLRLLNFFDGLLWCEPQQRRSLSCSWSFKSILWPIQPHAEVASPTCDHVATPRSWAPLTFYFISHHWSMLLKTDKCCMLIRRNVPITWSTSSFILYGLSFLRLDSP